MNIQMENKLSNEEIARVFAMYWQAKFIYNGSLGVIRTFMGITRGWNITDDTGEDWSYRVDKCKLLLTPLDKITDEHAMEFAKMKLHKSVWTANVGKQRLMLELKEAQMSDGYKYGPLDYNTYQQLILWGYDVPLYFGLNHWANGKTAIELGIAIEK